MKIDVEIPRTKEELSSMWKKGDIRPFYEEACFKCQQQTDYLRWR